MAKQGKTAEATHGLGGRVLVQRYHATANGLAPIMFQRYIDNEEGHPPQELLYLDDDRNVCIPSLNLQSFFGSAESGRGCAGTFPPATQRKNMIRAVGSYLQVEPLMIPVLRDGKPVRFGNFGPDLQDSVSGIRAVTHKALVKHGKLLIPQKRTRPLLSLPWSVEFTLCVIVIDGKEGITGNLLQLWWQRGGFEIGLGAFRPMFGRFLGELTLEEETALDAS